MEILSIENDTGDFLGLAITILYKDIVLLDYFAVDDNQRNNGAGSSALRMLLERYLGKRFLLEIEAPDDDTLLITRRMKDGHDALGQESTVTGKEIIKVCRKLH